MFKKLVILGVVQVLVGCVPSVSFMRYTNENFPPTSHVEVVRMDIEIGREYIELGELAISTHNDAIVLLVEKAKKIGADAIILIGEKTVGAVAMPVGKTTVAVPINRIYAIAIKYKN